MADGQGGSLQDLLQDWPYSRDYLLETLDAKLIERHAVMHLSRALNIGTVVAFLGAGVSMAYGRISWKNLVSGLAADAVAEYEKLKVTLGDEQVPVRLQTLAGNIDHLKLDDRPPGGDLKSDRYPSVFQLCAELSRGVEAARSHATPATQDEAPRDEPFTARVKARTRDSHFHAFDLLRRYAPPEAKDAMQKLEEAYMQSLFGSPSPSRQTLFGRLNLIDTLADDVEVGHALRTLLGEMQADHDGALRLKPSLRFLLPAALLHARVNWEKVVEPGIRTYTKAAPAQARRDGNLRSSGTLGSADIIEVMRSKLKIRRYLTTNYDLEGERLIFDRDFKPHGETARGVTQSMDPQGWLARDFVVMRNAPAPLVDFATREGLFEIDVAHLHGRALPGEPIVAAETQYQEFYLRDDGHRDLLEQAISLAFRGNTLLFVGNGMGEDDILRPLRHFMSEGDGPTQPPAVALLPDLWGEEFVLEEKISLLRRYGVYALHWGRGCWGQGYVGGPKEKAAPAAKAGKPDESVLPRIKNLIKVIGGILNVDAPERLKTGAPDRDAVAAALKDWKTEIDKPGGAALRVPNGKVHLRRLSRAEGSAAPERSGRRFVEDAPTILRLEWKALAFALRVAAERASVWEVRLKGGRRNATLAPQRRAATPSHAAARVIAAEIEDAILAAFLAATLDRLVNEWRDWRTNWFPDVTETRLATRQISGSGAAARHPLAEQNRRPRWDALMAPDFEFDRRHALQLQYAADDPIRNDRNFRPRFSQTYAEFIEALAADIKRRDAVQPQVRFTASGRRVFFLAGRRGLGKGHLFSALTNPDAFLDYAETVAAANGLAPTARFFGLHAMNLSFSVEIGSAFDRMADFMHRRIKAMFVAMQAGAAIIPRLNFQYVQFVAHGTRTTGDRVGALRFLLEVMSRGLPGIDQPPLPSPGTPQAGRPEGRLALVINAAHLMFNTRGFAKSAEIQRLMSALLDPSFADAEVDIFFIGSEERLPAEIRYPAAPPPSGATHSPRASAPQPQLGREAPPAIQAVAPLPPNRRSSFDEHDDGIAIDTLRIRIPARKKRSSQPSPSATAQPDEVPPQDATPGFFFHRIQQPRISVVLMTGFPRVALALARHARFNVAPAVMQDLDDPARLAETFFEAALRSPRASSSAVAITREDVASYLLRGTPPAGRGHVVDPSSEETRADRIFGRLYKDLGRSRLCVSIVCAAADERLDRDRQDRPGAEADKHLAVAAETIQRLAKVLGGSTEPNREDSVIRAVIDHYQAEMEVGWLGQDGVRGLLPHVPIPWLPAFKHLATNAKAVLGRLLFRLDEDLLAALAMIGQPVEPDCLAMLNLHAFQRLEEQILATAKPVRRNGGGRVPIDPQTLDHFRIAVTEHALDRLVRRCLVFRFTARSEREVPGRPKTPNYRYSVHRLLQRHVFRRMHQPRVEFPEVSNFMPTLYADQPNDLPHPSSEARNTIRDMMVRLSFYPSRRRLGQAGDLPNIGAARAARMLRAAYGVARSVLSLAVVTRFDSYVPGIPAPTYGFIEEHRHAIRWLTRRAHKLAKPLLDELMEEHRKAPNAPRTSEETRQSEQYRDRLPFFTGDLVWLHNECGVLSLAQGRLPDAAKLFAVALRVVQRIEAPTLGGAHTNVLRLNRAIVDIEMGQCRKADDALRAIVATVDEHRAVRWIAHGYRGLVAHIIGDTHTAVQRYTEATEALRVMQRFRAASIFARHHADLLRRDQSKDAQKLAETAVNLATIGNHVDVYQLARIARLRAEVAARHLGREARGPELMEVQKTLADVATYARTMGMPRIALEAAHLDASIRLEIGDLHYANISVTRALSLAHENGMTLKKVALTILLARIYKARGLKEDARLLAENARDLATGTEYAHAQDEAQKILAAL